MACSFQFVLYPFNDYLPHAQDEFLVGHMRLFLRGNTLELVCKAGSTVTDGEAREPANRYAKALATYPGVILFPVSPEEVGQWLPSDTDLTRVGQQGHRNQPRAIREARNGLLASGDVTLRRAYDYLQDARDKPDSVFSSLYKCIEVFKKRFGGWPHASKELKVSNEINFVKKLANEPKKDLCHPPGPTELVEHVEETDKARGIECATRVVRAYEQWVMQRAS